MALHRYVACRRRMTEPLFQYSHKKEHTRSASERTVGTRQNTGLANAVVVFWLTTYFTITCSLCKNAEAGLLSLRWGSLHLSATAPRRTTWCSGDPPTLHGLYYFITSFSPTELIHMTWRHWAAGPHFSHNPNSSKVVLIFVPPSSKNWQPGSHSVPVTYPTTALLLFLRRQDKRWKHTWSMR